MIEQSSSSGESILDCSIDNYADYSAYDNTRSNSF